MYTPNIILLILDKSSSPDEFNEYLKVFSAFLEEEASRLISLDTAQPFFEVEEES